METTLKLRAVKFRYVPWLAWLALALGASPLSAAQDAAPQKLVQDVTEDVLTILREDKAIQQGDVSKAGALIETKIAPHFDFPRMTQLAVGRAWRQASPDQRETLTGEFRTLLVRTYANALTRFRDQTVSFKPASKGGDDQEVTVHSQIRQPGGQPISLNYSLAKSDAGEWKVFDVVVAEVSLVTNYRTSFASEVQRDGIDGLIRTLQAKNRGNSGGKSNGNNAPGTS